MCRIRFLITCVATTAVILATQIAAAASPAVTSIERPATGRFLVAKRSLDDPRFRESVVYLVEHGDGGTLGLIINRPRKVSLAEVVPELDRKLASAHTVHYGGPVGMQMILMLVRADSSSDGLVHVADDVYISSARVAFDEALETQLPASKLRFYVGHSGWAPGQLEAELLHGSWFVVDRSTDDIFLEDPDSLWPRLIESLEPAGIQVQKGPRQQQLSMFTPSPLNDHTID